MKKLLSIFCTTAIVVAPMTTLTSCGRKEHLDKGSSILFEFSKQIDGKFKVSIDKELLDYLWSNNTSLQTRVTNDVIKLIKFSFLKKISFDDKTINNLLKKQNSDYINEYSIEEAKENFKQLEEEVKNNFNKAKTKEGKNWNKFLMSKYSSYVKDEKKPSKEEIELLENKYKFDEYFSSTKGSLNIDCIFENIILKKQAITEFEKIAVVKEYIKDFKKDKENLIINLKSNNAIRNNFIISFNASQDNISKWVTIKNNDFFNEDGSIKDEQEIKDAVDKFDAKDEKYKFIPKDITKISQKNTPNLLFLSNSQRFLFNRYYETQAPISISEVVFNISKNKEFSNGISEDLFEKDDAKYIDKFLKEHFVDTKVNYTNEKWIKMISSGDVSDFNSPSVKKSDKLLSLSSDHSQEIKNIVYDYLACGQKYGTELSGTSLKEIIEKINRKQGNQKSFYGFKGSKIIYVANDGLHIVNIDGYELLKNELLFNKDAKPINNTIKDGKIDKETIQRFLDFQTFEDNKTTTEETKVNGIQHLDLSNLSDSKNSTFNKINDSVKNNYLKFLINNSLVKGLPGAYTNFDLKGDVDSWLSTEIKDDENDSNKWSIYQIEYMQEILGEKDIKKFIDIFISFENNNILKNKVIDKIENLIMKSENDLMRKYIKSNNDWKENIEKETKSDYPKLTFDLKHTDMQKNLSNIFKAFNAPKNILNYSYYRNGENK